MLNSDELVELAHKHLSPGTFIGVYSIDRLPEKFPPQVTPYPVSLIINTDPSNLIGKHWYAMVYYPNSYGEVFNSFGTRPSARLERWMNRHCGRGWLYQNCFLQGPLTMLCGYYCIYFLKYRLPMYPHLSPLSSFIRRHFNIVSTHENDQQIRKYFKL